MVFSLLINHCLHGFAKMNQLMSLLTLVFFLQLQISFSIDPHYDTCSSKKCGDLEITYPFLLINKQRSYCGYPGFEVSCLDGKTPYINISGDSYVIQHIWYENQSFQVINSHIMASIMGNDCSSSIKNLTLDNSVFGFANNHDDIILFRNCPDEILKENKQDVLECRGVAMYGNDPKLKDLAGKCGGVNSVPYDGERVSNFTKVLSSGVWLNWTANNCSDCNDTGGQCGFDRNTSLFRCFCSDRPHSHQCVIDPTHPIAEKKNTGLTVGLSAAGGGIVLTLLLSIAFWYRRKLKLGHSKFVSRSDSLDRTTSDLGKGSIYFGVPLFSYSELQEATDNFNRSRELGDGGFGTVYFGKLKDGREVAVKRLFEKSYKRVEQFMNEVQILTCLRHNNLVSLYGCTSHHCRELLLVYEYVPNGTVADHLYGDRAKSRSLPWQVRIRIAIETASALSYLHASDIIHRDVKTNNILLDSSFSVKVADFGLSRLFPNDVTHVSTAPQGTPGYLDPQYHQCYQLTDKSDVYSFGVLLIELISSLPAVDMNRRRQEINLSNYAMNRIQRCAFDELVDPQLGFMSDFKIRRMTTAVAELAFQCLQHDKEFRPSMDEVLEALRRIESADYEALKADEVSKNDGMGKSTMPPPSPTEDDEAKLLSNRQPQPFSPSSVIDKWGSRSTTPSTSK